MNKRSIESVFHKGDEGQYEQQVNRKFFISVMKYTMSKISPESVFRKDDERQCEQDIHKKCLS